MKRILIAVLLTICFAVTAQAKEWYEGGTLHRATVAEWLSATPENVLATTADMVSNSLSDADIQKISMEDIKKASYDVALCFLDATENTPAVHGHGASQYISLCMMKIKQKYAFIGTK